MPCVIAHVQPGSAADRLGLRPGDSIETIAGEKIIDQIDYQALICRDRFEMTILRDGQERTVTVRNPDWEPLGLTLDQSFITKPRACRNHCIFCFIDQNPPCLRETLYVKDDDWRLSLMMGNFVTLTNVDDAELDRIIRRRATPLYISVHATDPDARVAMMRNPGAARIMERLNRLKEGGIQFHCQVVLCQGWNDGKVLERTLRDLAELAPAAQSVALVPSGLTKYRDKLPKIKPYDAESAAALLDWVKPWQEKFLREMGTRFVFPSDEFFCLCGRDLPEDHEYEDYSQLGNGVGMIRSMETELRFAAEDDPRPDAPAARYTIACGTSAARYLQAMCDELLPPQVKVKVKPILNHFFGESITVTGLLTGGDLLAQLKDEECDAILLARSTVRNEGDLFLDGMSVEELRAQLKVPLYITDAAGEGLWRALTDPDSLKNG